MLKTMEKCKISPTVNFFIIFLLLLFIPYKVNYSQGFGGIDMGLPLGLLGEIGARFTVHETAFTWQFNGPAGCVMALCGMAIYIFLRMFNPLLQNLLATYLFIVLYTWILIIYVRSISYFIFKWNTVYRLIVDPSFINWAANTAFIIGLLVMGSCALSAFILKGRMRFSAWLIAINTLVTIFIYWYFLIYILVAD